MPAVRASEAPARANLLFVFADEFRGSALGSAGNADVRTPWLDALAGAGLRFTHACANSAVCTPARGTILTGCWPSTHRAMANDLPVDPGAPSMARVLGAAGYRCGYIGKWHLGGIPRSRFIPPGPERLGFDHYWAAWNCSHDYFGARYHRDTPEPISIAGRYEPEAQTDLALEFISDAGGERRRTLREPWCLVLSYGPPHEPYRPLPPGYEGLYDPGALALRPNCPDTATYRQDLADYYTHVTALDDQVGRLLTALQERGELERTLVVFTSDHGSMLGSQGRENKHAPWDEATVVPLLVRFGAEMEGRRVGVDDLLVGHVDLAPTVLGLLGHEPDHRMEGLDLSAHVLGKQGGRPTSIFLQALICADQAMKDGLFEWRGIRTSRTTYAVDVRGPWLLYDNVSDPFQQRNLIDGSDEASLALLTDAHHQLEDWMAHTADRLEPKEAVLARYGLTKAWEERAAHNRALRATART